MTTIIRLSYLRLAGVVLLWSTLLFFGCSKSNDPLDKDEPKYRTDVYLAGHYEDQAAYWKNGEKIMLQRSHNSAYSIATSIFVYEGDVHTIGFEEINSEYIYRYWKNGMISPISDDASTVALSLSDVFVSNGDVYLAGSSKTGNKEVATYWKNGKPVVLSNSKEIERLTSIFISGSDIYTAGTAMNYTHADKVAKYWKNGTPIILSENAAAYGIFVFGNDVYVTGSEYIGSVRVATYWKNGKPTRLTNGTDDGFAITPFVENDNVYISVMDYEEGNMYWKNGKVTKLTDNYSEGCEIFVSDGDLYATGSVANGSYNRAAYWKNEQPILLTDGTETHSDVYGVFVTKTLEE